MPPLCGTVVQEINYDQTPRPVATVPADAKYVVDGACWLNEKEDWFTGTMNGEGTYIAEIIICPKAGAVFNVDNCSISVPGTNIVFRNVESEYARLVVQIHAAHNYTHVVNKAGLLKNGLQYDQCVGCGVIQNKAVIPGWGKYYVKAPKTTAGKKSFTVKWKKQSKANLKKFNGYQVRYSLKKNMAKAKMVKVKKTATSKTIKKLKSKKKYYVQVRTYTKKGGKTFYSKWSPKKTVKTK